MEENKVIEANNCFYQVTVQVETDDIETGKPKKTKEVHLVDGVNVADVEHKVAKQMDGLMGEWKIMQIAVSKVQYVY